MRIKFSLIALTLVMGVLVSSCKKDPAETKTPEETQIEKLTGTWVLNSGVTNPVTLDGNAPPQDWTGFVLTLGDKSYQSTNAADALVWPANGTWAFGANVNTLVRDDGVDISVTVSDTSLGLRFTYTASGGRFEGIEGVWDFDMVPQ